MSDNIDPTTLTDEQIREAFRRNGRYWGSDPEWIEDQLVDAFADRPGIVIFRDKEGELQGHYQAPEHRR